MPLWLVNSPILETVPGVPGVAEVDFLTAYGVEVSELFQPPSTGLIRKQPSGKSYLFLRKLVLDP
jgi:hypothetical protein